MVEAISIRHYHPNAGECLERTAGLNAARTRVGAVPVGDTGIERCSPASHVTNLQHIVSGNLLGHLEIPILQVAISEFPIRFYGNGIELDRIWKKGCRHWTVDRSDR